MNQDTLQRLAMSEFDYLLPEELIAQTPLEDRSASRLMIVDRSIGDIRHDQFARLPAMLREGDLLVLNDSRVIPARLVGRRQSGGQVELLLLREEAPHRWRCLMRPARKLRVGERVDFKDHDGRDDLATATVIAKHEDGQGVVALDNALAEHLASYGRVPLPPYIHQPLNDDERYQTVYARVPGSAAAPTAGLHFTPQLLSELAEHGVKSAGVTLHVGLDTFRPVTADFAEDHVMHSEWCSVPLQTAEALAETRERGSRVIAVGTTAARTLESFGQGRLGRESEAFTGATDIFIKPGYAWTTVDAMITNFHLPKSTLLLMMSSFAGKSLLFESYREAVAQRYRFFSFGDAMLIV